MGEQIGLRGMRKVFLLAISCSASPPWQLAAFWTRQCGWSGSVRRNTRKQIPAAGSPQAVSWKSVKQNGTTRTPLSRRLRRSVSGGPPPLFPPRKLLRHRNSLGLCELAWEFRNAEQVTFVACGNQRWEVTIGRRNSFRRMPDRSLSSLRHRLQRKWFCRAVASSNKSC